MISIKLTLSLYNYRRIDDGRHQYCLRRKTLLKIQKEMRRAKSIYYKEEWFEGGEKHKILLRCSFNHVINRLKKKTKARVENCGLTYVDLQ